MTDDDRARLERIAGRLDQTPSLVDGMDATFLRKLAEQPPEEREGQVTGLDNDEIRALITCVGAAVTVEPLRPVEESARDKLRALLNSTTHNPEEGDRA